MKVKKIEQRGRKKNNIGNKMKLTIELVPSTSWYKSVRSNIKKEIWDTIRKQIYRKANYKCEICGGKGKKHPVECHEIWNYDDKKKIQSLKGFIALCPDCHSVKHIGLAEHLGKLDSAIKHLCKINNMSKRDAFMYIEGMFELWSKRSAHKWKLDISILQNYKEEE